MDPATQRLIEAVHRSPVRFVLAVTGGGASAGGMLLGVPGGSRTVLEILVPYHEQALAEFLGHRPEQFCSTGTAQAMARRALERARALAPAGPVLGVGCTASLATDREKRGDHRFHLTVRHSEGRQTSYALVLQKGARGREGEEAVIDAVLLNALAQACGVAERVDVPLRPGEAVAVEDHPGTDPLAALVRDEVQAVCVEVDGAFRTGGPTPDAVLPGSFNPIHPGHLGLAAVAAGRLGVPVAFELSVLNVDKPALEAAEVRRRLRQFAWHSPLWLTRAPTFAEKAAVFPGAVFVVGSDTADRIVQPRYYQDSPERMAAALGRIRAAGCRFLVAGREDPAGRFVALEHLDVPDAYRDLFTGLAQGEFHVPISSTQLRERPRAADVAPPVRPA
jgi:hypothetical protein